MSVSRTGVEYRGGDQTPNGLRPLIEHMCERYAARCRGDRSDDRRIIFVMGAASSYWSDMPGWQNLKDRLFREASQVFGQQDTFLKVAWNRLAAYLGPPPPGPLNVDDFLRLATPEQILSVAMDVEVPVEAIRRLLIESYKKHTSDDLGPRPQLGTELIAHFMRHRFIDGVVTFNFDESIDRAFENELGPDGFERIISDSQSLLDARDKRPRLLKLHGSISSFQSMRFTKDQTNLISPKMMTVLDHVVFGISDMDHARDGAVDNAPSADGAADPAGADEAAPPSAPRQAHLVTWGYSWNDPGFVNWVVSRLEWIRDITIVLRDKQTPPLLEHAFSDSRRPGKRRKRTRVTVFATADAVATDGSSRESQLSVDEAIWLLWSGVERQLPSGPECADLAVGSHVPAARHLILGHIFGPTRHGRDQLRGGAGERPATPAVFRNPHTAALRFAIELYLHLIKCNGMVNISVMARDPRINRYHEAARLASAAAEPPRSILARLAPTGTDQARETCFSQARTANELVEGFWKIAGIASPDDGDEVAVPEWKGRRHDEVVLTYTPLRTFIEAQLMEIWHADEVELVPAMDPRSRWLFSDPKPIETSHELHHTTERLIQQEWTHLLTIAETGQWLTRKGLFSTDSRGKRTLAMIATGDVGLDHYPLWKTLKSSVEEDTVGYFKKRAIAYLPWWRHNRHMTLVMRDGTPLGGIYFRRRLKSSQISPVVLNNPDDLEELFLVFVAYALRAVGTDVIAAGATERRELAGFADTVLDIVRGLKFSAGNAKRLEAARERLENAKALLRPTVPRASLPPPRDDSPPAATI